MRFYPNPHPLYCGIDVHARSLYVCLLRHDGARLLHRTMPAAPAPLLQAIAPYRDGLVVAGECLFTWYGRADLCAAEGRPFLLGQALSLKAMHGGKAHHDTIDAHKMAALWRGGMLPHADVSPAEMRATRDVRRRRTHLRRKRAALLAHVQHTHRPSTRPAIGKQMAYKANRTGVAERCDAAAVHKTSAVALALIPSEDERLTALALSL